MYTGLNKNYYGMQIICLEIYYERLSQNYAEEVSINHPHWLFVCVWLVKAGIWGLVQSTKKRLIFRHLYITNECKIMFIFQ